MELNELCEVGQEIGSGNFGIVKVCRFHEPLASFFNLQEAVCKSVKHELLESVVACKAVENEIRVLRAIRGQPCFVDLHYVHKDSFGIHMVMDMCDRDLFSELKKRSKFHEEDAKKVFFQLVVAVSHLHAKKFVHRDLKLENVLVCDRKNSHSDSFEELWKTNQSRGSSSSGSFSSEFDSRSSASSLDLEKSMCFASLESSGGTPYLTSPPVESPRMHSTQTVEDLNSKLGPLRVKLADFGLSKHLDDTHTLEVAGSPFYLAPELLKFIISQRARLNLAKPSHCELAADMWSLGIILYSLFTGRFPYRGATSLDLYRSIKNGNLNLEGSGFEGISEEAKTVLKKLLAENPADRSSAEEVLKLPWLSDMADLRQSLENGGVKSNSLKQETLEFLDESMRPLGVQSLSEVSDYIVSLAKEKKTTELESVLPHSGGDINNFLNSVPPKQSSNVEELKILKKEKKQGSKLSKPSLWVNLMNKKLTLAITKKTL